MFYIPGSFGGNCFGMSVINFIMFDFALSVRGRLILIKSLGPRVSLCFSFEYLRCERIIMLIKDFIVFMPGTYTRTGLVTIIKYLFDGFFFFSPWHFLNACRVLRVFTFFLAIYIFLRIIFRVRERAFENVCCVPER